ncbi:MFS transporter [Streptomyces sp. JJ36]|uniref:MFS transporter n=1 Tax=Streptomyces sp. JJ36 TaxID=2736645 RepID=UPI001F030A8C|nr:MFS transporter [Streptomyces sp. JJ36]MCF6525843.1 MFS transporter [Streptomyces sp. JJ36]
MSAAEGVHGEQAAGGAAAPAGRGTAGGARPSGVGTAPPGAASGTAGGGPAEPAPGRTVRPPLRGRRTGPQEPPAPEQRGESVLRGPYRALTAGIVSVVLLIAFEATAVGTAMPVAADELDGVPLYAFAFSAYFTTSLLGIAVSGQWADRRGPLPPLATGIGAFGAGLLLSGTAATMWVFVLGRAVQGVGGGLVIVALYVTISRAYPASLRPTVMAALAASWVVPSVVGPLVSGTVTEQLGWRWVFLGIPALVLLPAAVMLPPLRRRASGPPPGAADGVRPARGRIRPALAVAVGAGLLQYAGQDLRLFAAAPAAAGAVLLVPAARRLLPRGTFRAARGLPAVVLLRGLAAGAFIVAESFVPLMLVTQRGLSVTLAGLALAAGGATWALGSFTQSRPRFGPHRHRLARLGTVLVTAGIGYAPVVLLDPVPVWTLAAMLAVACYGMGLVISSTSVLLLELSAPEEAGGNSAALQTSDGLSNILLLATTGAVFAALGGGAGGGAGGGTAGAGHGAGGAVPGTAATTPGAFVAVYAVATAVAALGIVVAGRLRR